MLLSVEACPLHTQECNSSAQSAPPPPKRKKSWLTKIPGTPAVQSSTTLSPSEQVTEEMDRYLHHPILDVESHTLEWWKAQEKQFPLLGRLARRYLCICATSVPSERVFTSRSAHSARTAGTKIALRFPRLFVCASALITCAIYYVICYYATAVYSSVGGLQAKLQQMKVVLCCLDGKNVVGSRKYPGFLAYSY